jgi:hypothetical protein
MMSQVEDLKAQSTHEISMTVQPHPPLSLYLSLVPDYIPMPTTVELLLACRREQELHIRGEGKSLIYLLQWPHFSHKSNKTDTRGGIFSYTVMLEALYLQQTFQKAHRTPPLHYIPVYLFTRILSPL